MSFFGIKGYRWQLGPASGWHRRLAPMLPHVVHVHGAGTSEPASAAPAIVPGAGHVYDRGSFDFALIRAHLDTDADAPAPFVMRTRGPGERTPRLERHEARAPGPRDLEAGVTADHVGRLAGSRRREAPDGRLREVVSASSDEEGGEVRLLTDLLGVPTWAIGLLYRHRWQVELFFRRLKATAHFRHPLSERREAIAFEVYVAVIGALPLALRYEARPSQYAFALLHRVAGGGAAAAEVLPILAERERRRALDRESQRRRREKRAEARRV